MDSAKGNSINKTTVKKTGSTKMFDKSAANVENMEIGKPLDDLKSSLKYLPTGPSFNDLIPTEIKDNVFSSLSDSSAFIAASVCKEWKEVIESRFIEEKMVKIGNCLNCEDDEYIEPTELLKASATLKMDVHLFIGHPITEVDSKLVSDGLTSVSKLTISGHCSNFDYYDDTYANEGKNRILSNGQFEDFIEGLEKSGKVMVKLELLDLDLNDMNQERLASCLVNKVEKLTIDEGPCGGMLDSRIFINKLRGSTAGNPSHLTLHSLDLDSEELCLDLAEALCNIENVKFTSNFMPDLECFEQALLKRLIKNVITYTRPITMKTLIIETLVDFNLLVSPEDMRNLFNKMETLKFWGFFTSNQLEAVKSLPDVTIFGATISKGSSEIF